MLRVLTALAGLPLVVGAVWAGGWVFGATVALVAALAQWEFYGLARALGAFPHRQAGLAAGALVSVWALWPDALVGALAVLAVYVGTLPFSRAEGNPLSGAAATLAGVVYPVALLSALVGIRELAAAVLRTDRFDGHALILTGATHLFLLAPKR